MSKADDTRRKDLYRQIYVETFCKRQDHYYADVDAKQAVEAYDKFFNTPQVLRAKPTPAVAVDLDEEIPF